MTGQPGPPRTPFERLVLKWLIPYGPHILAIAGGMLVILAASLTPERLDILITTAATSDQPYADEMIAIYRFLGENRFVVVGIGMLIIGGAILLHHANQTTGSEDAASD